MTFLLIYLSIGCLCLLILSIIMAIGGYKIEKIGIKNIYDDYVRKTEMSYEVFSSKINESYKFNFKRMILVILLWPKALWEYISQYNKLNK